MRSDQQMIEAVRTLVGSPADDGLAFVAAVTDRVNTQPSPRIVGWRRRGARAVVAGAVVVASIVPGPRAAFARWLGIGSVRIEQGTTVSGALPIDVRDLDLGTPSSVQAASSHLGRPLALPAQRPIGVWTQGPAVNAVYVVDGTSVLVSELPGPGSIYASKKMMGGSTRMDFFTLRDQGAVWISGAPHEVALQNPSGQVEVLPVRLAGAVLLWADATRTIRIEGFTDQSKAVAFFESLRLPA
jgi:hypothetical protein